MSTESASFADVLSRLQHSVAGPPAPVATPALRPGSRAAGGARSEPPPSSAWARTPGRCAAATAKRSRGAAAALGSPAAAWFPSNPWHRRSRQPRSLPPSRASSTRDRLPQPRPTGRSALHLDESAALVARAMRLGVPAQVLEDACDAPTVYRRLLSWVESRPPAPLMAPAPGQVIAVVGELAAAMRVARTLSFELGVDPSGIHLAVPATSSGHDVPVGQLLSDPADIAVRRHRWRQSTGSTIVVVEAALPPAARAWVSSRRVGPRADVHVGGRAGLDQGGRRRLLGRGDRRGRRGGARERARHG